MNRSIFTNTGNIVKSHAIIRFDSDLILDKYSVAGNNGIYFDGANSFWKRGHETGKVTPDLPTLDDKLKDHIPEGKLEDSMLEDKLEYSMIEEKLEDSILVEKVENQTGVVELEYSMLKGKSEDSMLVDKVENQTVEDKFEYSVLKRKFDDSMLEDKVEDQTVEVKLEYSMLKGKFEDSMLVDRAEDQTVEVKLEYSMLKGKIDDSLLVDKVEDETIPDGPTLEAAVEDSPVLNSLHYRLVSLVLHYGSHDSGHFVTLRRFTHIQSDITKLRGYEHLLGPEFQEYVIEHDNTHPSEQEDVWYRISDERVDRVRDVDYDVYIHGAEHVYLLFYEKVAT